MPRRFRATGQARRTNWLAAFTTTPADLAANSDLDVTLFDPGGSGTPDELSTYVGSTLVRLRGWITLDPIFAPSTLTPQHVRWFWAVYVGQAAIAPNDLWASDRIIATGGAFWYANTDQATGTPAGGYVLSQHQSKAYEIDSKAMRKLEDDNKVILTVVSDAEATAATEINYMIRGLFKE